MGPAVSHGPVHIESIYCVVVEWMSATTWTPLFEEHRVSFSWVLLAGLCIEERSLHLVYRMNLYWKVEGF